PLLGPRTGDTDADSAVEVDVAELRRSDQKPPAQFVDHRPYQRTLLLQRMDVAEQQVELQAADPHSQSESRSGSTPLSSSRRASGAAFSVPAGLTTTTVHFECRTTCSLTEPRTRPLKPPRPRRPTTTMSALSEASI